MAGLLGAQSAIRRGVGGYIGGSGGGAAAPSAASSSNEAAIKGLLGALTGQPEETGRPGLTRSGTGYVNQYGQFLSPERAAQFGYAIPGGGSSAKGGKATKAATSSTGSAPIGAPVTNTAQTDPNLQYLMGRIKERTEGPGVTERAMDRATSQIRDAGEGLSRQISEGAARRGVGGTGAEALQQRQLGNALQRDIAGAMADISLGREQDIDRLLLGAQGTFQAPGQQALQDRALANQAYATQQGLAMQAQQQQAQLQMAQQQQNMMQQQAILQALSSLW